MRVSDFHYHLPGQLIAHYPTLERTGSRLMHVNRNTGEVEHAQFKDLQQWLTPGDLLVFNDTRVIPARLFGVKATGGKIEVLIERIVSERQALAHIRASKAPKPGMKLILEETITVEVINRQDDLFLVAFESDESVIDILEEIGHIPLPPYIPRAEEIVDHERYQTVYARRKGAIAAPTAGLHFDNQLLHTLEQQGVKFAYLTLHVGAGTFQPVRVTDVEQHIMHGEWIDVPAAVCEQIKATKQAGGRVIAVGTTTVRSLETAARTGKLQPFQGETNIFIYPGFQFQCIDALVTNFHLPASTLLMLVCAFGGYENMMHAYRCAVKEQYRFFSYGDAMLIS